VFSLKATASSSSCARADRLEPVQRYKVADTDVDGAGISGPLRQDVARLRLTARAVAVGTVPPVDFKWLRAWRHACLTTEAEALRPARSG
jgi:hypothetical protein